jgi:DNA polymerase-3 subunit beta
MRIQTTREALLVPFSRVAGIVERTQTLPILNHVKLVAQQDGTVVVTGTDMELELVCSGTADVISDGQTTLPAKKTLDILKALPDGAPIQLSLEGEKMKLISGRSNFSLNTMPAADYPQRENLDDARELTLEAKVVSDLINRSSFAMAQNDARYFLNGSLIELKGNTITAVATDGHRLSCVSREVGNAAGFEESIIIPRKAITQVLKIATSGEDTVMVRIGSRHAQFKIDGTTLTTKLIDARFPDYQAVIPAPSGSFIKTRTSEMINALQRIAILADEKSKGLLVAIGQGSVTLSGKNAQQDEGSEEILVEQSGNAVTVGCCVSYLLDALNAIASDEFVLHYSGPDSAILIVDPDEPGARHIVMPMKV